MILLYFLVFLSSLLFLFYYKQQRVFKKLEHIPGPPMLPFLGNALEIGTNSVDILRNFKRLTEKYGPVVRLCLGWKVFILLSEPKYILQAVKLNDDTQAHEIYENLVPLLGRGLLTLTGKTWSRHRKILNRSFTAKHLEKYTAIFNKNGDQLVTKLSKRVGRGSMDITHEMYSCFLNITCNAVMQVDVIENEAYLKAADGLLDIVIVRFYSVLKKFDVFYRFTSDFKKQQAHMKTLDEFYEGVLAKIKMSTIASEEQVAKNGAIVDELLNLRGEEAFTDEEVRGEMQALITAGSETAGGTTTFILYELAKHPDVQEKILEEARRVFGVNKKANMSFEDVQQLKYTECVVKETLRLYSPAHVLPRRLSKEAKFGDMTIPGGADVLLYLGAIHRSPDYYQDPEKFLPERFLAEGFQEGYAFIPFGVGPKMCLGHRFAMLEMKVIIAKLVQNFEFLPAQPQRDIVLKLEGVLKTASGVPVTLKFRE